MGDGTKFQCSSASRKFLNASSKRPLPRKPLRFSALQRAENSSIDRQVHAANLAIGFSALQRAENSSIARVAPPARPEFSVSVLFSEPKIPQLMKFYSRGLNNAKFQCSSASRKFLNYW